MALVFFERSEVQFATIWVAGTHRVGFRRTQPIASWALAIGVAGWPAPRGATPPTPEASGRGTGLPLRRCCRPSRRFRAPSRCRQPPRPDTTGSLPRPQAGRRLGPAYARRLRRPRCTSGPQVPPPAPGYPRPTSRRLGLRRRRRLHPLVQQAPVRRALRPVDGSFPIRHSSASLGGGGQRHRRATSSAPSHTRVPRLLSPAAVVVGVCGLGRGSGIVALAFMTLSVALGVASRSGRPLHSPAPVRNRQRAPLRSARGGCW